MFKYAKMAKVYYNSNVENIVLIPALINLFLKLKIKILFLKV